MTTENSGQTLHEIAKDIVTKEEEPPVHIGNLLNEHGLAVMHVRPIQYTRMQRAVNELTGRTSYYRPMTVVYRVPKRGDRVIEIATAVLHPLDDYSKKVGAKIAIDNFLAGKTVLIPRQPKESPVLTLRAMFGGYFHL